MPDLHESCGWLKFFNIHVGDKKASTQTIKDAALPQFNQYCESKGLGPWDYATMKCSAKTGGNAAGGGGAGQESNTEGDNANAAGGGGGASQASNPAPEVGNEDFGTNFDTSWTTESQYQDTDLGWCIKKVNGKNTYKERKFMNCRGDGDQFFRSSSGSAKAGWCLNNFVDYTSITPNMTVREDCEGLQTDGGNTTTSWVEYKHTDACKTADPTLPFLETPACKYTP